MKKPGSSEMYVDRVRRDTQQYAQDLLRENEKLRTMATTLEAEQRRLQDEVALARRVMQENEELTLRNESLMLQVTRLGKQVERLDEELALHRDRQEKLEQQLQDVASENQRYSAQYLEVEQQNTNLANLYVASFRLHSTMDRDEVLSGILEIIINLVGSEEVVVYELDSTGKRLDRVTAFGMEERSRPFIRVGEGVIGHCVQEGRYFVAADGEPDVARREDEETLTACVPLILDGRTTGAIAIYRLLEQKQQIESVDRELFEMLATHAATALYATGLNQLIAHRETA